jgi:regulator of cell morphogenesis and NO signaling
MSVATDKTLREIALENPAAPRVLERLRLDYCCGGKQTLQQACNEAGLSIEVVTAALDAAVQPGAASRDWQTGTLAALIAHIQDTHHRYTRDEIVRLSALFEKVCNAHGQRHAELFDLRGIFQSLADELMSHMMKEEMILFPYIERLEASVLANQPPLPSPFGTVRNPIAMMLHEHDDAGQALRDLRRLSAGYTAPDDACVSFRNLYLALTEFEADLHQHIHLENNLLFPRAVEMESRRG